MLKSRYVMIGGFLGAGKTTAILQIARRLSAEGKRVGLITNDQSVGLVDTAILSSQGFPTEEVSGGCFCCHFNSLMEALQRLEAEGRPDVFLAEPVGSCTDLVATVLYPLRKMYGENYAVAPLSVMVDPVRAQRIYGLKPGKNFAPKVGYIYEKQLEEADIIVVNKVDLLDEAAVGELTTALRQRYSRATVIAVSSRTGEGMDTWMEQVFSLPAGTATAMDVDYATYAEGEALLGWVNISAALSGPEFDGNRFLAAFMEDYQQNRLADEGLAIAHMKTTIIPAVGNDIAVAHLVREEATVELSQQLVEALNEGEIIVNLRAEDEPKTLRQSATESLQRVCEQFRLELTINHAEAFRPVPPNPTHRLAGVW